MASPCERCVLGFLVVFLSLASVKCDGDGEFSTWCHHSWLILEKFSILIL